MIARLDPEKMGRGGTRIGRIAADLIRVDPPDPRPSAAHSRLVRVPVHAAPSGGLTGLSGTS